MEQTLLQFFLNLAKEGTPSSVEKIMTYLNVQMTLPESKFIDYALGQVCTFEGVCTMQRYLFQGTQIQRNYCALYFGRRGDYHIVRKAYDEGLIDATQAFSR